jgi:lysozyme
VTSAQGIDVSAFQLDLTAHDLSGLSFAFTKATDGLSITDPHFAANWATIRQAGLHRGAYHELQAGWSAAQAAYFLAAVQRAGLRAGDMLAVVASDYPGVTDEDVLIWCETVTAATHGRNPVEVYTDLSVGASLARCSSAGYGLWAAWPSPTAPPMPLANWHQWRLWQWGTRSVPGLGNVDANAYNGTPADMDAWIGSFQPPPPPPPVPHPGTRTGDTMLYLPTGEGAVSALPVPTAVLTPDGGIAAPTALRLVSNAPAAVEYMLGNSGVWVALTVDYNRSPAEIPLQGAAVVKVQRADKGSNLVAADFT